MFMTTDAPGGGSPDNKSLAILEEALNHDQDLILFFLTWIKHNRNGTKAYQELHPNVSYASARVMGSQHVAQLAKLNISVILAAYDLDQESYFKQLKDGMEATKWNDFTGENVPDHKVRRAYHETLGKILGIEQEKAPTINVAGVIQQWVQEGK